MLLLPLLIVGFGICPSETCSAFSQRGENVVHAKPTNQTLIKNAEKFVNSSSEIHLLMYSDSIEGEIPKCISSKLLKKNEEGGGVLRTLEANGNITADFGKPMKPIKTSTMKPPRMRPISIKANVTVYVGEVYPTLQVKPDEGTLPPLWEDVQTILHAEEKCIILEAGSYNGDPEHPPCTLWGYKKKDECEVEFKNLCGDGIPVDLSECEHLEEGDSQIENQN